MMLSTHDRPKCRARSSRTGEPCQHWPIRGGAVCRVHGGSAPQVKANAVERLQEMVDPLLTELWRIATSSDNEPVRLAAIKDALDRAGVGKDKASITGNAVSFTLRIDRGDSDDQ